MCVQAGVYFSLMDFSRCLFALAADMSADRPDSQVLSNVVKWCKEGLNKLFFPTWAKAWQRDQESLYFLTPPTKSPTSCFDILGDPLTPIRTNVTPQTFFIILRASVATAGPPWQTAGAQFSANENSLFFLFFHYYYYYLLPVVVR